MCRQVETDYREGPDEDERLREVASILSAGVYAYLKKRGLLAPPRPQMAKKDALDAHEPGGEDSP